MFQQLDAQIASLSSAARSRAGEARGRSATQPNLVYQSIKTDYLRAAAEASSAHQPADVLTQQLAQINARLTDLETLRNQYDDLTRAVQIQNDTYKTLAIRYETARVEANRNAQKISAAVMIAAPTVGQQPARPRRKVVALATSSCRPGPRAAPASSPWKASTIVSVPRVMSRESCVYRYWPPSRRTRRRREPSRSSTG